MTEEKPFGELGDLVESLVPIAARLVEAVRTEGPNDIRGVLASVPDSGPAADLPGGNMAALAIVLAAMVDPDARVKKLLDWTTAMLPAQPTPEQQERERLVLAGVHPERAAQLAAGRYREGGTMTTRQRMLRVVQGGKASA